MGKPGKPANSSAPAVGSRQRNKTTYGPQSNKTKRACTPVEKVHARQRHYKSPNGAQIT